ncbi:hypothetical protein MGYG_00583 [Nannizzia gypsea CBS 118893]|uniref:Uncharacterized protein n=1 Tax=Arthroderma gypseum (strain ATCC MYA-4604 / CBS 118893) TaxID=535722 RepID=E5R0I3_ARTGP|nr:hypothetical protein MGYG_00583 [Nannizzia gypsea CBS 118893]EFQ97542.1 hypothetical protein MGYG_00583 [Nannizzia gypsea CBS 118893]
MSRISCAVDLVVPATYRETWKQQNPLSKSQDNGAVLLPQGVAIKSEEYSSSRCPTTKPNGFQTIPLYRYMLSKEQIGGCLSGGY